LYSFIIIFIVLFVPYNSYSQNSRLGKILTPYELASNFLKLYPDSIVYSDQSNSKKWNYEQGLMMEAFYRLFDFTHKNEYSDYIKKNLDYYVDVDGKIKTYKLEDQNLDNISPGKALLNMYSLTKNEKYKKAADTLRKQLSEQPRTKEGGFWHKKIYPHQMWLDGLFMAEPFYADYASLYDEKDSFTDIANQFLLIEKHCRDKNTGLYYHGWDESKSQKWADPETGTSPCFWGRAMGWYLMALVDVLDYFPQNHPQRNELIRIFRALSSSLINYRDPKLNLWYQVVDKGSVEGNYIETSGSLMFIYAFAKGSNNGYLTGDYYKIAEESFQSIQNNFITNKNGLLSLTNVCAGAGLGGSPYRDGSYNYYIHELKRINDFKGYGPLLLASVELENGNMANFKNRRVGLDYFYNNEYKNNKRYHYIWEDHDNSGFSELGKIIKRYGTDIDSIPTAPSLNILNRYNIYIIVDPDTPGETAKPNYIETAAIKDITAWVKKGGILVLLANDSANCEFTHLNKLAEQFGIHFNEDSENRVSGKKYDMGKFDGLPNHPIFKDVKKIYLKEISTIKLSKNALPVLKQRGKVFMAASQYGKGFVFAVGDPWLYNEYIDNRKLPEDFDNFKAAENLFGWLLNKTITLNK
jgi:unsaturated rhamnogalacturonyl hydrolase